VVNWGGVSVKMMDPTEQNNWVTKAQLAFQDRISHTTIQHTHTHTKLRERNEISVLWNKGKHGKAKGIIVNCMLEIGRTFYPGNTYSKTCAYFILAEAFHRNKL
jgi:hypothetical protein